MKHLREIQDELSVLVDRTAEHLGFPASFVLKDFWIVEILRSLVVPHPEIPGMTVLFKGGTSLSKAYGLIDRISEDIDILLVFPEPVSKGAQERALKSLTQRVVEYLGIPERSAGSTTSVKRNTRFLYPGANGTGVLSEGVLLEMGVRGGSFPRERRSLRSYVLDFAMETGIIGPDEFSESVFVDVDVLNPVRTLIEKTCALHDAASRLPEEAATRRLGKYARHYYDIQRLITNANIRKALPLHNCEVLAGDVNEQSARFGFEWTARPSGGYAKSAAFSGSDEVRKIVEPRYREVMSLVIPGKPQPSFDEGSIGVPRR